MPERAPRSGRAKLAPRRRPPRRPDRARRTASPDARRTAILEAALKVFAANGFEHARLDEVAAKAGVAKGTLYLHFRDKEALFEDMIRAAAAPILAKMSAETAHPDLPVAALLERLFALFRTEVLGTERKLIIRLVIAEGARFPRIAAFYHREVVSRVLALVRRAMTRAAVRGEISSDAAARFPELVMAPLLLAVIWDGLFQRFEPLDVKGLLAAHAEVLTGSKRRRP